MAEAVMYILYILLGAVAGMIFSLRRIFLLEKKIMLMDIKIEHMLEHLMGKRRIKKKKR